MPIGTDNPKGFVELDPQHFLLILGMDQGDYSVDIILKEGINSDKATFITLLDEETLIADANLFNSILRMCLNEAFFEIVLFLCTF